MRGLDPRIHGEAHLGNTYDGFSLENSSWIAGSSPAVTVESRFTFSYV